MHICFLEGDMSRSGGTERMTAWLANALCKEHQVTILSLRLDKEQVFFSLDQNVCHQVLPKVNGKTGILKQICRIHRFIQANHIEWIINVDIGMGLYGILAAKGTGAKTITWEHGNFYNNWGSRNFPYMRRYAARKSNAVVVLTERDKANYRSNISGCAPLYVIPNPAPQHDYVYDCDSRIILSVGHLLENKGYHRVVEMAKSILPEHPEWKWIICGEGPERQRLETLIHEAGMETQILLPGLVKDMDSVYRKAAMVVMTSDMEGLPMVLLEGKAYGLPLVAFDIMTGPSDIIEDGVNGYLVEAFDLNIMKKRIEQLVDDAALRKWLSKNFAIGIEKFTEETILNKWKDVFEK